MREDWFNEAEIEAERLRVEKLPRRERNFEKALEHILDVDCGVSKSPLTKREIKLKKRMER